MVLQDCYVTQITGDSKSNWLIKNSKDEVLYELPAELSEQEVMAAVHFARHFELKAFVEGKEQLTKFYQVKMENEKLDYETIIENLKQENIRLAEIISNSEIFKGE